MARITISYLEEEIERYKNLTNLQLEDIDRLNKELESTKNKMDVVGYTEFNGVVTELDSLTIRYKVLNQLYKKEKSKDEQSRYLRNENYELRLENEQLQNKILVLEKQASSVINIELNANPKRAGRKQYQDINIILRIFSFYAEGLSLQKIADRLNEEGIFTKAGGTWAKSSIRFILLNKSYLEKGIIDKTSFSLITERMKKIKS